MGRFGRYDRALLMAGIGVLGALLGAVFLAGLNATISATSTTEFCLTCHEMEIVYREYQDTIHYKNPSGVRVSCGDCHVPREQPDLLISKISAVDDIYGHLMGTIDTPEKFEAKRLEMAQTVWNRMESTGSRECRNCHAFQTMDFKEQRRRARRKHPEAMADGKTCIDCHKGVAHSLPDGFESDDE